MPDVGGHTGVKRAALRSTMHSFFLLFDPRIERIIDVGWHLVIPEPLGELVELFRIRFAHNLKSILNGCMLDYIYHAVWHA